MLKEHKNIQQISGEPFRRWYSDDYFDLIAWFDDDDKIISYQLCYDKPGAERVLTYTKKHDLLHEKVDSGEEGPEKNRTPILVRDGSCPFNDVTNEFIQRSEELNNDIRLFILLSLKKHVTNEAVLNLFEKFK